VGQIQKICHNRHTALLSTATCLHTAVTADMCQKETADAVLDRGLSRNGTNAGIKLSGLE
jgi:hypothetical protein